MENIDDDFVQEAYDPETGMPKHQPLPIGQLSRSDEPAGVKPMEEPRQPKPQPMKIKKEEPKKVLQPAKEQPKPAEKTKSATPRPAEKAKEQGKLEKVGVIAAAKKPQPIKKKVIAKKVKKVPPHYHQSAWDWQKIGVAGIIAGLVIAGIVFSFAFSSQKAVEPVPIHLYDPSCASEFNLTEKSVIFVTMDDCAHCSATQAIVQGLIDENYSFHLFSLNSDQSKTVLAACFKDVIKDAVPQFICAGDGSTLVGIQSKASLKEFADECKK